MTSNRSSCCNATVTVVNQDEGTNYYACDKCKMPCDVASDRSKEWEFAEEVYLEEGINGLLLQLDMNPFYFEKEEKENLDGFVSHLLTKLSQQRAELIEKVEKLRGAKYVVIRTSDKAITGPMDKTLINKNDVLQLLKGEL